MFYKYFINCFIFLIINIGILTINAEFEPQGSTEHLRDIFVGRCWSYLEIGKPTFVTPGSKDCEEIWDHFLSAFAFREPCSSTSYDYEAFVTSASVDVPTNQTMFWSGTYAVAHEYANANKQYVTLEDTLLGYIMHGLVWCGQKDTPGVNYESCPLPTTCGEKGSTSFWASASNNFASGAKGEVTVILNGSNSQKPAFDKNSYFAKHELVALRSDQVTQVTALVVHSIDTTYREDCKNGSLPLLEEAVSARGLTYRCIDDPQSILHLMCVKDVQSRECQLVHRLQGKSPRLIG